MIPRIRLFCILLCLSAAFCGCGPRDNGKVPKALPASERGAREQKRQHAIAKWTRDNLTKDYESAGTKSPAWDDKVQEVFDAFAELHAARSGTDEMNKTMRTACGSAVGAGCTDPLVQYFNLRFVRMAEDPSTNTVPMELNEVAARLYSSSYSHVRKFYASLRAMQELARIKPTPVAWANRLEEALGECVAFVASDAPNEEIYLASKELLTAAHRNVKNDDMWQHLSAAFTKGFLKSYEYQLLKGDELVHAAWKARGSGYADSVSADQWKVFHSHMKEAQGVLETGYSLNPFDGRAPASMITVGEGLEMPRDKMELWFARAMSADPDNVTAAQNKMHYLMPQWYGSYEQMAAFGRECVTNQAWGAELPLELVAAHLTISNYEKDWRTYLSRPDVYEDVRFAYKEYFQRENHRDWERQNWMRMAYLGGAMNDLREQYLLAGRKIDPTAYANASLYEEVKRMAERLEITGDKH